MDIKDIDEKYIIELDGKKYIKYDGVRNEAHRLGLLNIKTEIIQFPAEENKWTIIVKAIASTTDKEFHGIGDANPENVGNIAEHYIRCGETRAKARPLRDLCNIDMVCIDEMGTIIAKKPTDKMVNYLSRLLSDTKGYKYEKNATKKFPAVPEMTYAQVSEAIDILTKGE